MAPVRKSAFAALACAVLAALFLAIGAIGDAFAQSAPVTLHQADLSSVAGLVQGEVKAGRIPGAVVEIGQADRIVYRRAFGFRELKPQRVAMTPDTIFDLASLTKAVATSIAIMQLKESGQIDLDSPAARYWPNFARHGKQDITVRQLMTHYSGLEPDLDLNRNWSGYAAAIEKIEAENPKYTPGTHYKYSDINFEVLGEIVTRVSGSSLDQYCENHIFRPLHMIDTGFRPATSKYPRIAPSLYVDGKLRIGEVHDPTAARMDGIAGHAGLFSTADDLSILARALLNAGHRTERCVLTPRSIAEMTAPSSPTDATRLRGLGWDLAAPFALNRDDLPPLGSYGHTGFTGTMLWIDPVSGTYVIVLTNRTYPNGGGDAQPLRKKILTLVSNHLGSLSEDQVVARRPELRPYCRLAAAGAPASSRVATGIDVLVAEGFAQLKNKRVGLITNQTGVTSTGVSDIDAFSLASGVKLAAIFSPEHGLYGEADDPVASGIEPRTGLPFYSLYGKFTHPTDAMLQGLDALVFDVQDSGARFYTYATTMAYAMEAAALRGIDFYVLDRPNPISADAVQGPILDSDLRSFTGYFPLPTRHGMTIGELAEMFNRENHIGASLHVVSMHGYRRGDWFDETGLRWIPPSPNLRTLAEATLYPGVAMLEGANVSVGRGTDTPFEVVGAPWIDGKLLQSYLAQQKIAGIHFDAAVFTPSRDRYAGRKCEGVEISLDNREALDSPGLGIELAAALDHLYPDTFKIDSTLGMIGSARVLEEIKAGRNARSIAADWEPSLRSFHGLRARYLLYESAPSQVAGRE